jgi:beta-lactamase regulating signal transducer with metallopeptidase domain
MERMLIEYAANAVWQVPLLAVGAWLLLRMAMPGPLAQHRVWLATLGLALLLPLHGTGSSNERIDVVTPRPVVAAKMQTGALFSKQVDSVGEPGGLVLGAPSLGSSTLGSLILGSPIRGRQISGVGSNFSWKLPVHVRQVRLSTAAAHWIAGLYLAMALFGLFRIVWAWFGARRLVKNACEIVLSDGQRMMVTDCARRLRVALPRAGELQIRESCEIPGPVVVGAIAPVLLWPEGFANHSEDEVTAALCHEMAHIRRRDYLVNLLCEAAALPLKWHPAIYGVQRRIRGTREMVCDAMAAEAMQSETVYATCLLRLAQSMITTGEMAERVQAPGLFSSNVLEERVMRLIQGKTAMNLRARIARGAMGATAMMAAIALAAAFHVAPTMAQTEAGAAAAQPIAAQSAPVVEQATPVVVETQPAVVAPAAPTVAPVAVIAADPAPLPAVPPLPAPQVQPAPVAQPTPTATAQDEEDTRDFKDGKPYVIVDGQMRKLTPEEQQRVEKQLAEAQKQIAAATAKINSPEFRKQIEDAQRKAMETEQKLNSGEFQKKMADAQKQIAEATAKINSPEFRQQIAEAQRKAMEAEQKLNSGAFQKQMADAQKQIAEATARINSPEFRQQIEEAQRKAMEAEQKLNNGEFQKQMADALAKMKAEQEKDQAK